MFFISCFKMSRSLPNKATFAVAFKFQFKGILLHLNKPKLCKKKELTYVILTLNIMY